MSDSQLAELAITLLIESCNAASTGLSEDGEDIKGCPTSDFITLRTDFLSLLSIIYAATTKVALSLKPSASHPKASLVPLKDLTNNVAAIVHSIRLMRVKEGSTLTQEYEKVARGVINAVRSLGITLTSSPETSTGSTEEYLVRTGEIHELIDSAKKTNGLSLNNREAVCRIFAQDHESMKDAAEELQGICKPVDENSSDDDEEDDFDDGWAELGISSNPKLSPYELSVAEKVQSLVKLGLLLHKRIIKDILPSYVLVKENSSLDKLAVSSGKLVIAFDDLISSMYAPHQASNITTHLGLFQQVVRDFQTIISPPRSKTLEEQLGGLSVSDESGNKTTLWFSTCFDQISKAIRGVSETLQNLLKDQ
ncbi:hypothetical protein HYPSUDRAFT_63480 [Hypholoma sublateritium FD-334 SS-4]|uniref:Uncharacterized protein n=1 Tax=Hypholoma sublateritium (strain FD-334 SS-4) TaxID=945553 RepID=A0A0D2LHY1_HYPSF|nr:hypothetical protein HYPSUDRAFT_63480 [Hypholoma sublateritium FD-334 SS-4]